MGSTASAPASSKSVELLLPEATARELAPTARRGNVSGRVADDQDLGDVAQQIIAAARAHEGDSDERGPVIRVLRISAQVEVDVPVQAESSQLGLGDTPDVAGHDALSDAGKRGHAADLYFLLRSYLRRTGRVDMSMLAADRAMRAAEDADDPLRIAAAQGIWVTSC
ncbi:hypothetical protein [Streptacidiphilus cavernicola]|uniref:Uncharacterized protein n=1 Tax=Streptacidiphilus cavernicola TaxID=3342716 RepID=A0ABV6VXA9_9ACTN